MASVNTVNITGLFVQISADESTNSSTRKVTAIITIPPSRDNDLEVSIPVIAYGKKADELAQAQPDETIIIINGTLNTQKNPDNTISTWVDTIPASTVTRVDTNAGFPTINTITLTGRAGSDTELRFFESGSCVANVNIAVDKSRREEQPNWFRLEFWNKTAEIAGNYLKRGGMAGVVGALRFDVYNSGNTQIVRPVIRVDVLNLLSSSSRTEQAPARQSVPFPTAPATNTKNVTAPAPSTTPASPASATNKPQAQPVGVAASVTPATTSTTIIDNNYDDIPF